ncbi:glycosyltransferase family 9 protein [Yersinia nurmii]|uniref:Glycosyltransferase family 9 protein n=1 Tax=Yersinia nurmii TaxID=685706 RepID=A0AAW7K8U3_9GAMM|nr:glycosyltransferase family 9 protein [Yersinia nurmii]MDN0088269.1 glycosyltransferase family 9 protein [Yersinia nurmii]CNE38951.1 putative sugar transferase [Yersinia nurmii]
MLRILVTRIDFLGDMVCTTALIHALKQHWPEAEIHVLANKYNAPVLDRNPDVAAVHTYVYSKQCERNLRPGKLNALIDRLALIWRLRRLRFNLAIIPNGGVSKNSIQFVRQLNVADCRWHTAESEFDDRVASHAASRQMKHESLSGFTLLPELASTDIDTLRLYIYPKPQLQTQWRSWFGDKNKPRIGLFISNKSVDRRWSWQKWHDVIIGLEPKTELFIFHDPAEKPTDEELAHLPARCLSTPSVPDMIAAMSQLDLVVSADSAPIHLSAALQIPVVALFENRPEKYLRWYPLGVPHILLREGRQVEDIQAQSVIEAVSCLLDSKIQPLKERDFH